jgi:hypothetical protein
VDVDAETGANVRGDLVRVRRRRLRELRRLDANGRVVVVLTDFGILDAG